MLMSGVCGNDFSHSIVSVPLLSESYSLPHLTRRYTVPSSSGWKRKFSISRMEMAPTHFSLHRIGKKESRLLPLRYLLSSYSCSLISSASLYRVECVSLDTRRLISHSSAESEKFLCDEWNSTVGDILCPAINSSGSSKEIMAYLNS